VAAALACGLLGYGVLLLARPRTQLDWRFLSAGFLVCWIGLDLAWQSKLWHQLGLTRAQFSGLDSRAKLLAGPDGALVQFMSDVHRLVSVSDARVFVASADDFHGMRGSYYLYPMNVFWQRHGPELPARQYIHGGDYIVVVQPTGFHFDPQTSTLRAAGREPLPVQRIASAGPGGLYRML
jgi:hypothetical protein